MTANKTGSMDRQRSKFIYEYLPQNTFNHAHNGLSGQIRHVNALENDHGQRVDDPNDEEGGLPKVYVAQRIHTAISKWHNEEEVRSDIDIDESSSDSLVFVNPGGASYVIFPLTFECHACGSIRTFKERVISDLAEDDIPGALRCKNCRTPFTDSDQLRLIGVCPCGGLSRLRVPTCDNDHSEVGLALDRSRSSMSDWQWYCPNTTCSTTVHFMNHYRGCPRPDCENKEMSIHNHMDSETFYAQVETLINVTSSLDRIYGGDDTDAVYRGRITSDYLLRGSRLAKPSDREIRARAAEEAGGWEEYGQLPPTEQEDLEGAAKRLLMSDTDDHRQQTRNALEQWFPADSEQGKLAEELYEYLTVVPNADDYTPVDGLSAVSYREIVAGDITDANINEPHANKFNQLRQKLNLSQIQLMDDYPITTVSYGYSRMKKSPDSEDNLEAGRSEANADQATETDAGESGGEETPVQLNLFVQRTDEGKKRPHMFTQSHDAEGILIRLDKRAVLDWLETNEVITGRARDDSDIPASDASDEEIREWFMRNVEVPGRYEEFPTQSPVNSSAEVSRHSYTLLNTMAHLFINSISALSGHQRESLKERIMPRTMSFVIYKSPDADFTLGTIRTLFEQHFDDVASHIETELNNCSYDPVCTHAENGACEDCLYIPVFTTENANHNLSRATFYGGPFDDHDTTDSGTSLDDLTGFQMMTSTVDRET